ncbi:hypothetical protein G6N74_19175 [Mesorhizobium sp. CGMCC 1.15528]|uniref:Uncharacterized protein n=1 Tax=Mesorhizobium zhangyense TaxID=1776730 RepID=A0A7C9R974_9HYPH|nr:hypothetical protein [Mesorhizobium zhangyense]NGN43197.1 hypothetical protein [Mesorhizobium zhangyense]
MSNWNSFDPRYQSQLRFQVAALKFKLGLLRTDLKANFNPNQPRVPTGNSEGGQWTDSGGAGGGLTDSLRADATRQRVVQDREGEQPWSSYAEQYRPDGSVASRTIVNRNGSRIVADYPAQGIERNTVTLPNGTRVTFENNGDTQRIFDARGNLLSESTWTLDGPASQPILLPAFFDDSRKPSRTRNPTSYPTEVVLDAATELYNWWLSTQESDEHTIFSFRADELLNQVPGEPPAWMSGMKREDVEYACPRFPQVQTVANYAANSLNRALFKNAGAYGTAVHMSVKNMIDALGNPNLTTEESFINRSRTKLGTVSKTPCVLMLWKGSTKKLFAYTILRPGDED